MSYNGKFEDEPMVCSPVQPMVVNNYYGPALPEKPLEPVPDQSPAFGVKLFLALIIASAVWWICWGWEMFK